MTSIIYTPKDIYEQDFKTSMRGYDKREVDEFLDDVIKDYESYIKQIQKLSEEVESLKKDLAAKPKVTQTSPMSSSYSNPIPKPATAPIPPAPPASPTTEVPRVNQSATNLDILKRISRLEKEVFGKQIVE